MKPADPAQRMADARTAQVAWASLPIKARVRRMRPLRSAMTQHMDEIVQTVCEEVGKPAMDALAGDVMVTLEQLRFYERRAPQLLQLTRESKPWFFYRGARFFRSYEPHGIALILAPWNYPFQLSVVPMATALIAGNAVLLKCSEHTPRTARLIQHLCDSAGLPAGLIQVSCEGPEAAGALIDAHPDVLFFTGSAHNGSVVAQKAAALMIPTIMELGGKDAALVFASCDLERTVNGIAYGGFSNTGQVCVGTKRIYVQQSVFDKFLPALLKRVGELRTGSTMDSDIRPVRLEFVRERLLEQVEDAVGRGATLHTGSYAPGNFTLFVLTGVPDSSRLMREETFGPVVCVAAFKDEDDAIRAANASPFQLSASVWTGNLAQGKRVASRLDSGSCAVNDVIRNIGNAACAFGGNRASGHGRYHGADGLYGFSRVKTVMIMRERRKREVHWFPFQPGTYARLRKLLMLRHDAISFKRVIGRLGKVIILFAYLAGQAIALRPR
jgi:4,4'-diapolycopenoate synthase